MPLKQIKTSYNAGELSEYMASREDINKYHNGASVMINATVLPHGGFVKRSGTEYIATAPNKAKLLPFEFSVDDALVLEFSNLLIRFYKDQSQVFIPYGTEDLSGFTASIKGHWPCNDNLGDKVVVDADGATHNGATQANTNTITAADESGTANKAFDLGDADYVTVGDHADFTFGNGTTDVPFTFLAWGNYQTDGTIQTLISKSPAGENEYVWSIQTNDKMRIALRDDSSSGQLRIDTVDTIDDGWHFFAVTYNGSPSASAVVGNIGSVAGLRIYIDWQEVDTIIEANTNYTAMENVAGDVELGGHDGGANLWVDKLHNVAILGTELSAIDIASLTGSDSTTSYSITSPYTSAQAFQIHTTQSADVMYIAHKDVHPQKLSRLADTNWKIEDVPFTGGPFLGENTISTSLVGFARTGGVARSEYYFPAGTTGTLTASGTGSSIFNSSMVGGLWLVKHTRDNDNDTDTFAKDTNVVPTLTTFASGAIFIKGDATVTFEPIATGKMAQLWRKEGNGNWQTYRSFRGATSFSWTEDADDVLYAMTRSDNTINGTLDAKEAVNLGVVKITAFTSSTVVTVEVVNKVLSDNSTDGAVTTPMWAEGAWSDYRGYPRTVTFFEDRLWWASTTNNPDTLWSSKSGDYENMEYTDLGVDDDAITAPINDNEVSNIQWMLARQVMAVGAANKEYRFGASNPDDPVTPADRKATPQTGFGSGDIQPVLLNDTIFFFQRQGKKLGAMRFDVITENFDVEDATLLAYKLFDSAPTDMAVQRVPDSLIWSVRTDGVMPTFTYEPKEEVAGWARQIFGNSAAVETNTGTVESVAVIHGSAEDEVWASVLWTINSSDVRHIVKFKARDWGSDIEDAFFVDSGVTYDSTAASTMTGGTHLIGETVAVFADGTVFDDAVVNGSGEIVLRKNGNVTTASTVQWGIPYTMKVRTMRLSAPQEGNTFQTRIKRIHSTIVRFIRSLLGSAGQEYAGTEYLQDIQATYSTDSQDTGENERLTQGGFSEDAYTTIVSDDPVPFTALSTVISYEVEERK